MEEHKTLITYHEAEIGPEGDEVAICEDRVGLRKLLVDEGHDFW